MDLASEVNPYDWPAHARPGQLAPPGDWRCWLLIAGRGFGKTRALAEWVRARVEGGLSRRIALVESNKYLIEELINICPPNNRPLYEPSKRRIAWPNGAIATSYSELDRLRGPQHDTVAVDELIPEAWDMLMFGLRGVDPRVAVATPPCETKLLRDLIADPTTVVVYR